MVVLLDWDGDWKVVLGAEAQVGTWEIRGPGIPHHWARLGSRLKEGSCVVPGGCRTSGHFSESLAAESGPEPQALRGPAVRALGGTLLKAPVDQSVLV